MTVFVTRYMNFGLLTKCECYSHPCRLDKALGNPAPPPPPLHRPIINWTFSPEVQRHSYVKPNLFGKRLFVNT